MKRFLICCFLMLVCGLILGAVRPGGLQPIINSPISDGIRPAAGGPYRFPTRTGTSSYPLGGHTWSSAIGHNEQYWALGGDVGGTWTSTDGGSSWQNNNEGIANDQDQPVHYTRDIISVKNSYFEGFILATDNGIYKKAIPFASHQPWTSMIDQTDNDYLSYTYYSWGDWLEVIGFGSLGWDGDNMLAATAGRNRYNNDDYESFYPWNVADGDTLTGDDSAASWSDGDWSDNSFGKAGLWIYDFSQSAHGWHPVETGADTYKQKWGRYKSVDVAVVGSDTLYIVATSAGPKLLTVNGASKVWTDIDEYTWQNVDLETITDPLFTMKATTQILYHYNGPTGGDGGDSGGEGHITVVEEIQSSTPATGTLTLGGTGYAYESWSGSTFDLDAVTLAAGIGKGWQVTEPTDTQATWSVMITNRGDIYCAVTNEDQQWDGDSGLYKLDSGATTWKWVGDGYGMVPTDGFQGITTPHLLSVADIGAGAWTDSPMSPEFAYNSLQAGVFDDQYVWVSGNEGLGSDPDTLYLGGNGAITTYRALSVDGAGGGASTRWSMIVNRDYTTDPIVHNPYPDLERHAGTNESWALKIIHEMAVDPENSSLIFMTPSDQAFYSTDGGTSWANNVYSNSASDANFFKSTGIDELCITGIAVLGDGRLISTRGDVYAGISQGTAWEYSTPFRPLNSEDIEDCTSNNSDDILYGYECNGVIVTQGWAGVNPTDDYIILNNVDPVQQIQPSKMFIIHDDNDDGDFYDAGEWDNIGETLPSANKYIFPGSHITNGTDRIWVCFDRYNKVICDYESSRAQSGVLEYYWNDPDWEYAIIDSTTLDGIGDVRPKKLQYDPDENRLWAAAPYQSEGGGGVYMIDLDDGTPTWLAVFGEGAVSPYDSYETKGAVESLAISDDNSVIYWGTTGRSGKAGGIWRITNPGAATNSFTIERVLNDTGLAYAPTITTSRFLNSRESSPPASSARLSSNLLMCSDILIDPTNNDQIWFVNGGNYNRLSSVKGLYALDTSTNEVVDVFPDDPRSDFAEGGYADALIYTDATDPPRIVWGTQCIGVSFFEYNGTFPVE